MRLRNLCKTKFNIDSRSKSEALIVNQSSQINFVLKILFFRYDYFTKEQRSKSEAPRITSAAFCKQLSYLVTGFENGDFYLHEMPDFNLIHSLRLVLILYNYLFR